MRRIYACVLVLGILGTLGFGVVRGLAQTEGPALKPDQIKPVSFTAPSSSPPAGPAGDPSPAPTAPAPEIQAPNIPLILDPMPGVVPPKSEPMAVVAPAVAPAQVVAPTAQPAPVVAPMPEIKQKPADQPAKPPELTQPAPDMNIQILDPVVAKPETSAPKKTAPPTEIVAPKPVVAPQLTPVPVITPVQPAIEMTTSAKAQSPAHRVQPSVSIETIAPESVNFGEPVVYEIIVKNIGQVPVTHVRVDEELSPGSKLIGSEPAGDANGEKILWMLGSLNVGDEKRIKVTVKPGVDGDLATKPRMSYAAATAMSVHVNRPNLLIEVHTPDSSQVGEEVPVDIKLTNNGSGDASKIVLKALLSDGLKHPEGNDIQAALNKLAPGEHQKLTLRVHAALVGMQLCSLSATADGAAKVTTQAKFDVKQPKLALALSAPAKCMVRSEPVFSLEVSNPGSSPTEPVQIAAAFPEGLDFLTASDGGAFDAVTRTVSWNLGSAPAGSKRTLTVKVKSSIAGHMAVRAVAQAGPKLHARAEASLNAEGVPALLFEVVDLEDPIEVGKETTYEIRVSNTGSTHCTNVRLTAALSDGLVAGAVTSSVPHKIVGQTLVFEPIAKLAVKADLVIRVKAKGTTPGDQRFKVQLSCDQLKQPVVKEESTSFFQQ